MVWTHAMVHTQINIGPQVIIRQQVFAARITFIDHLCAGCRTAFCNGLDNLCVSGTHYTGHNRDRQHNHD